MNSALRTALGVEIRRVAADRRPERAPSTHLLVAAFPKSGSTYLSTVVAHLPSISRVHLVPHYGRREQELDPTLLRRYDQRSYVAQHHVRYSQATHRYIVEHDLRVVVLVRNIGDVFVSLLDHTRHDSYAYPMAYVQPHMLAWTDEDLLDFLIEMAGPWYFSFFVSWADYPNKLLMKYEDLLADPKESVRAIAEFSEIKVADSDITAALEQASTRPTRRRVGRAGRGAEVLSPQMKSRIETMARHWPTLDFSPIGISRTS